MFKGDYSSLSKLEAKKKLIALLQSAHAGEKAAAYAYWGHAYSPFIKSNAEKKEILKIRSEELHHRAELRAMLSSLGASPNTLKEMAMNIIGMMICVLCIPGGWYIPMYGAGKLESKNIEEYEVAARLAWVAGRHDLVDALLAFAEVEWDHEAYFRSKADGHFLNKLLPLWPRVPPREHIRKSFDGKDWLRAKIKWLKKHD